MRSSTQHPSIRLTNINCFVLANLKSNVDDISWGESISSELFTNDLNSSFINSELRVGVSNGDLISSPTPMEISPYNNNNDLKRKFSSESSLQTIMWRKNYIGLFAHYAGVAMTGTGLALNFCTYFFRGSPNVCANATAIISLPWSFKLFYAMGTDSFRPFGLRRKPYMVAGWIGVLVCTLILAIRAPDMDTSSWMGLSVITQMFLMLADVPADGYTVECGKLEAFNKKGMILATAQQVRFSFIILVGCIQAFLVNGPATNPPDCPIDVGECWSWGLTVAEYYGLLFGIMAILFIPICFLKELDASDVPQRTFDEHRKELWETLQNRTTLFLLIFVSGSTVFAGMANTASVYLQYYVIQLVDLQSGIDNITTALVLTWAVWLFQKYLLNKNWQHTQYVASGAMALMGLMWLIPIFDLGGLRNAWFTIFINTNQSLPAGITQLLFSMAVIELARPGQEAITYELIVSTANAALTLNNIIATQLLSAVKASACNNDDGTQCSDHQVDVAGSAAFDSSDGPRKFAEYTLLILLINVLGTVLFTPFLPRQKDQCVEWRRRGEEAGDSARVGCASIAIATVIIGYGVVATVALLLPSTACLPVFGGAGC